MIGVSGTFGLGRRGIGISVGPTVGPGGFLSNEIITWQPRIELSPLVLELAERGTQIGQAVAAAGGPAAYDEQISDEENAAIDAAILAGEVLVRGSTSQQPSRHVFEQAADVIVRGEAADVVRMPEYPISGEGVLDKPEEPDMAVDWGNVLGGAARGAIGAIFPNDQWDPFATLPGIAGDILLGATTPNVPTPMVGQPTMQPPNCGVRTVPGPRYLTYDCRTGQFIPKRRRRRRRLLTPTDLSDLAALAGVIGKGSQGMQVAVARAVGGSR